MRSPEETETIRKRIAEKMAVLSERIVEYRELTKPIPPENAIGRVSRMDAINNKSVSEAALRQAEKHFAALERASTRLDDDRFGLCVACGQAIPDGRILLMPSAMTCVSCASR
jgi:DnaK suppressor protein